ncbi:MAG: HisA/HisF-related TIM barrel protein [Planctomycetaceae bacterium]|nr:HisA/HisF-related TIM barrel protein [Planctomycetaceae bacterium]
MRVIPVIDLLGGQVVRGIGGRREEYRPIVSQIAADARPATVARGLVERFGFDTAYVADLDAIVRGELSVRVWHSIADAGMTLWLDAGISDRRRAGLVARALESANIKFSLIVGLESLQSLDELSHIKGDWGAPTVSLDLREQRTLARASELKTLSPLETARVLARSIGIEQLIVLDLADVGSGSGTRTLGLCREIRDCLPQFSITAGGGVRGLGDLKALADAGCDAALVASALHDGRLTREDVERAREFTR